MNLQVFSELEPYPGGAPAPRSSWPRLSLPRFLEARQRALARAGRSTWTAFRSWSFRLLNHERLERVPGRWIFAAVALALGPVLSVPVASWSSLDGFAADLASSAGLRSYTAVANNAPSSRFAAVARPFAASGVVLDETSAPEELQVRTARLSGSTTLVETLANLGASPDRVDRIVRTLAPLFDPVSAQDGDYIALSSTSSGELVSFEVQHGRDLYRVAPGPRGQLLAVHSEPPMDRRVVTLGGVIKHSLYEALYDQGERAELVQKFADIFAWQIDFTKETRPGDEYRLVYEKYYDRGGFVRYGRVLAAQYAPISKRVGEPPVIALYYEGASGVRGYYTPAGTSLRGSLLRAPVNYTRISSRYTQRRLHPVHRVYKPHLAVDYAAPTGTPVWAAGDGVVIFKGWRGGLGRTVKVRHVNGYVSYYGHLSRYADIKVGDRVAQKQVLGYVGMSGTATGPHLDYRLEFKGRFVDPLKVEFESDRSIPVSERMRFVEVSRERLERLREANPPIVLEAAAM